MATAQNTGAAHSYKLCTAHMHQDAHRSATSTEAGHALLECPFCNYSSTQFLRFGVSHALLARLHVIGGGARPNAICPRCGSVDRERLVYLYLRRHVHLFDNSTRLLHVAPERCLRAWLTRIPTIKYISADLTPGRLSCRMDITHLPMADKTVDCIVCNHVLEHVPDDGGALTEFRRILKPTGFAILQVPIAAALAKTYEDDRIVGPRDRQIHFGQRDHVRIYGQDYRTRLEQAGFECTVYDPQSDMGIQMVRRFALIEGEVVHVVTSRAS
jgi:predicted SAM-dependent methyltransferase